MIIEFVGLPASGKSSIAKEIEIRLMKKGKMPRYPLKSLYSKTWLTRNFLKTFIVMGCFVRYFNTAVKLLRLIINSKQDSVVDVLRLVINNLFILHMYKIEYHSNSIIIFDEGLLHHYWAINIGASSSISLEDYFSLFDEELINIILIYIEVDPAILAGRIKARNDNNRRHIRILNNIESYKKTMEFSISKISGLEVLRLNNNDKTAFENNINKILELINLKQ